MALQGLAIGTKIVNIANGNGGDVPSFDSGAPDVPDVSYVKWDCNRYLTQPGSPYLPPSQQSDLWVDYVNALYGLMVD